MTAYTDSIAALDSLGAHLDSLIAERDSLRQQRDALADALRDAEFLLRKCGINWAEARSMADSMLRSADDAKAALAKVRP